MNLFKFFMIFVKIGAILLGGGYVILPIMNSEFAEKRHLLTKEEILDYFALSQSLPGIVAANMSIFLGYRFYGKKGALLGVLGVIFVPFWSIIVLASVLGTLTGNTIVQSAFWGIGIAVVALILLTIREIWQTSDRNLFFYIIFTGTLVALIYFKISPVQAILIFSFIGVLLKKLEAKV